MPSAPLLNNGFGLGIGLGIRLGFRRGDVALSVSEQQVFMSSARCLGGSHRLRFRGGHLAEGSRRNQSQNGVAQAILDVPFNSDA